jgi:DNA-binding beta-propeller fold protein YncE
MQGKFWRWIAPAFFALPLLTIAAHAQIAVSANDNKSVLVNGANTVPDNAAPDTVTIVDLGTSPPKILGEIQGVPASVIGPPQSVAVSRDESFALVTGAFKVDPANPKKIVPDDTLSVIDLKAKKVTQTLQAGKGAAGVSINRAGTLALVANRNEGTVSIFTISGMTLTPAGKIDFGDPKSGPCHAAFTPDGKTALVTRDGDHKISILSVDGDKVTDTKKFMVGGYRPYSLEISSKGDVAVAGNAGGGQGDAETLSVIDLKANPPRVVDIFPVGQTPEGVFMSGDGAYIAVTLQNGTNRPKEHWAYNDFGLMKIYAIDGTKLTQVAETKTGRWCQGAAFSKDNKTVVIQCMVEKALQVFAFDGKA